MKTFFIIAERSNLPDAKLFIANNAQHLNNAKFNSLIMLSDNSNQMTSTVSTVQGTANAAAINDMRCTCFVNRISIRQMNIDEMVVLLKSKCTEKNTELTNNSLNTCIADVLDPNSNISILAEEEQVDILVNSIASFAPDAKIIISLSNEESTTLKKHVDRDQVTYLNVANKQLNGNLAEILTNTIQLLIEKVVEKLSINTVESIEDKNQLIRYYHSITAFLEIADVVLQEHIVRLECMIGNIYILTENYDYANVKYELAIARCHNYKFGILLESIKNGLQKIEIKLSEKARDQLTVLKNNTLIDNVPDTKTDLNVSQDKYTLHELVRRYNTDNAHEIEQEMQKLLSSGHDINSFDESGSSPLCVAIERNMPSLVKFVLMNGATFSCCSSTKFTALHVAVSEGNYEIVSLILDTFPDIIDHVDDKTQTALHYAADGDKIEIAKLLLSRGANLFARIDIPMTALDFMSRNLSDIIGMFRYLFKESGRDINYAPQGKANLPIISAIMSRKFDVFVEAINLGADVDRQFYLDDTPYTYPLHFTCEVSPIEFVKELLDRNCLLDKKNSDGMTALHIAAVRDVGAARGVTGIPRDHFDVMRLLINKGMHPDIVDNSGQTILHHVVSACDAETAKGLIEQFNCNVNAEDNENKTPLHLLIDKEKQLDIQKIPSCKTLVLLLLEKGCSLNRLYCKGISLLHYAILHGTDTTMLEMIKVASKSNIDYVDSKGCTPLHYAIAINRDPSIIKALLDKGANAYIQNNNGLTPMHYAVRRPDLKSIILLKNYDYDINHKFENTYSLICTAIIANNYPMVEHLIIKMRANIDESISIKDLHLEPNINKDEKSIVNFCLKQTDSKKDSFKPLELAEYFNNGNIIELIKKSIPKREPKPYDELIDQLNKLNQKFNVIQCEVFESKDKKPITTIKITVHPKLHGPLYTYLKTNLAFNKDKNKKDKNSSVNNVNTTIITIVSDNQNLLKFSKGPSFASKDLTAILDKISKDLESEPKKDVIPPKIQLQMMQDTGKTIAASDSNLNEKVLPNPSNFSKSNKEEEKEIAVVLNEEEQSAWMKSIVRAFIYSQEIRISYDNAAFTVDLPKITEGKAMMTCRSVDAAHTDYYQYQFPQSFIENEIISRVCNFFSGQYAEVTRKDNQLIIKPKVNLSPNTKDLNGQIYKKFATTKITPVFIKLVDQAKEQKQQKTKKQSKTHKPTKFFYKQTFSTDQQSPTLKQDVKISHDEACIKALLCDIMGIDESKLASFTYEFSASSKVCKLKFDPRAIQSLSLPVFGQEKQAVNIEYILSSLEDTVNANFYVSNQEAEVNGKQQSKKTMSRYINSKDKYTLVIRQLTLEKLAEMHAKKDLLRINFQFGLSNLLAADKQETHTPTLFKVYRKYSEDLRKEDKVSNKMEFDITQEKKLNCQELLKTLQPYYRKHLSEHLSCLAKIMSAQQLSITHLLAALLHAQRIFTILARNDSSGTFYNWRNVIRHCYTTLDQQAFASMLQSFTTSMNKLAPLLNTSSQQQKTLAEFVPVDTKQIDVTLVNDLSKYELALDASNQDRKKKVKGSAELRDWLSILGNEISENNMNYDPEIRDAALAMVYSLFYETDRRQGHLRSLYGRLGHDFSILSFTELLDELLNDISLREQPRIQ